MKKSPEQKEIRKEERKIGLKASKMVESSVINQLKLYGLDSNNSSADSLRKTIKSSARMGEVRLFGISTTMARHGFIHQHGKTGMRSGTIKTMKKSGKIFGVKEHTFYLTKRPFIEVGIEKSGAFEYLFNELGKLRMKEVAIIFNQSEVNIK